MIAEGQIADVGRLVRDEARTVKDRRRRPRPMTSPLDLTRLGEAKQSFATRRAMLAETRGLLVAGVRPAAGDLVLARVEQVGHHARLELPDGRRSRLYEGDEIVVAYGARYAPDQFEAEVPSNLGPCDLIAGGGLAGRVLKRHRQVGAPTRIAPCGLLADSEGRPLNLARWAVSTPAPGGRPTVIVVAGTSMNAGKTTTAACLIRGLKRAGLRVGAAKVTGTGSGGDLWAMVDAGARPAMDFTDLGHASTFKVPEAELVRVATALLDHLAAAEVDAAVIEIADGLFQAETAALLSAPAFTERVDAVLFAAGEAAGAAHGVDWLRRRGLPVVGVTGLLSASPLAAREAVAATGAAVLTSQELSDPEVAPGLVLRPRAEPIGVAALTA
ncbi:DUF1611 domain-containing protein [Caulobacter sp. 17J80-11]|uniref:DUF1611 domain-containing protein n=1 Tax=Caulobacter sp. 17J80-11 TaxID=2763502 RepID=UPI002105D861|nr:DUF1611 domain-containing protein [Caulobacter sp. 17J80-11]